MIISAAKEAAGIDRAANVAIKRVLGFANMGCFPGVDQRRRTRCGRMMFRRGGFIFVRTPLKKSPLMAGNQR